MPSTENSTFHFKAFFILGSRFMKLPILTNSLERSDLRSSRISTTWHA